MSVARLAPASFAAVDITSAAFKADPFPFYARLRAEAPVHPVTLRFARREQRAWLVTRYDDVLGVLKAPGTFTKDAGAAMTPEQARTAPILRLPGPFRVLQQGLLSLDGERHARLRALVHKAFAARQVERMRETAEAVTEETLDRLLPRGGFDVVGDFALPVALRVIGRILGVPDEDHARFSAWTRALVGLGERHPLFVAPTVLRFLWYMRRLVRRRSAEPRDDLISALVVAREADDRLSEDEVLAMIFLLLSAGHETTVNLIGSGTLALLNHPSELARWRGDAALGRSAVEELLRFVVPAETATERYAREDTQVAGTRIPRGELVLAVLASANRDAARFSEPDRLDLARADNRHLAFGQGVHACIGASLTRLEAGVAFAALLRRAPDLRLARPPGELRWRSSFILRGLEALPVRS
ncbi:cytochrome P450 [Roseomonas sp. CCTCC AB2023176]|uniref:cytochrome P450 family protein n=1 Tax=Roseomonas sp. CCTCC AB2023176 TaxID=3342640 RepID=UPI0035D52C41